MSLLYAFYSPPSRGVLLTIRNLKLDLDLQFVDIRAGEPRTEKFKKINPISQVPVYREDDFILTDSHAIMAYLVGSKAPGNSLYPADLKERALVDSRMYYDSTMIFAKIKDLFIDVQANRAKEMSQKDKDEINNILLILNEYLEQTKYIAVDHLTIADFSIVANVSSFMEMGFDISNLKYLTAWYKGCESLPGFEENVHGAKTIAGFYQGYLDKNNS